MDSPQFRSAFSEIAAAHEFLAAHGGWFRESAECVVVLDLQKSNFGNYFDLNVKVFVQGLSDNRYTRGKEMVKKLTGDVFRRPPDRFQPALDLDRPFTRDERARSIEALFNEFVGPFAADALTRAGLASLATRGLVYLLPAVRAELGME